MTCRWMLDVWIAALWLASPMAYAGLGLNSVIPLPGVHGQFGHLAVDATHHRLYVCVTGRRLYVVTVSESGSAP